jgi:hypothetical protein
MKKLLGFSSAIAVMLFACGSAKATLFTISDGSSQQVLASTSVGTVTPQPNGASEWKGSIVQPGSYTLQWDLLLDPDPSVAGAIALTNTSATTQTFTLNVSQPISPTVNAGAAISGSSSITLADANGDTLSTVGAPTGSAIYTAFINSPAVNQRTLFVAPYTLAKNGTPGGTAADSQSIGAGPGTTAAATIIGIQHSFTLTSGDSATMNSTFAIVPEPCTMVLAAIGGLGLIAVRRSRRE